MARVGPQRHRKKKIDEGKFVPANSHESVCGIGGITPHLLNVSSKMR